MAEASPVWDPTPPEGGSPEDWAAWANELPMSRQLGLVCTDLRPGHATFEVRKAPVIANPNGSVHGGLLVALADQCMGAVTIPTLSAGMLVNTAALHARFHRPALPPLFLEARVARTGRSLAFVDVTIEDSDGRVCMTAEGTMAIVSLASATRRAGRS
jgi:uncharacterized protein (TIGR00369 family)